MTEVTTTQLLAVSAAVLTLENWASSGLLSDDEERKTRELVQRICNAFRIPTIAERSEDNVFEISRGPAVVTRR